MYNRHIIIDFEMNPVEGKRENAQLLTKNEIIQIGAIKLDEKYHVVDRFNAFARPQLNSRVTRHIKKITGITTEMVVNANCLGVVLKDFSDWLGVDKLRIYAWSENDLQQLREECAFKGIQISGNMKIGWTSRRFTVCLQDCPERAGKSALQPQRNAYVSIWTSRACITRSTMRS